MATRASDRSGEPGLQVTTAVNAPRSAEAASAPATYGVRPLALSPMTRSAALTPAASARPAASLS